MLLQIVVNRFSEMPSTNLGGVVLASFSDVGAHVDNILRHGDSSWVAGGRANVRDDAHCSARAAALNKCRCPSRC